MKELIMFYDDLAKYYHLIYPNWNESILKQADDITAIVKKYCKKPIKTIHDATCGIGTQAIGLAQNKYIITASDISHKSINRARLESRKRNLKIKYHQSDILKLNLNNKVDAVISFDNSMPHLLTKAKIRTALTNMYNQIKDGGYCLISLRDYAKESKEDFSFKPYGTRSFNKKNYILFQTWSWDNSHYDLDLFIIEKQKYKYKPMIFKSRYYAIPLTEMVVLMKEIQFRNVKVIKDMFYQPVIIGTK